jgi:hypothetical protein
MMIHERELGKERTGCFCSLLGSECRVYAKDPVR